MAGIQWNMTKHTFNKPEESHNDFTQQIWTQSNECFCVNAQKPQANERTDKHTNHANGKDHSYVP